MTVVRVSYRIPGGDVYGHWADPCTCGRNRWDVHVIERVGPAPYPQGRMYRFSGTISYCKNYLNGCNGKRHDVDVEPLIKFYEEPLDALNTNY